MYTCNTHCHSLGMMSDNREDKIQFIRDGLSKEPFDDISLTLETHPNGYVDMFIVKFLDYAHNFIRKDNHTVSRI